MPLPVPFQSPSTQVLAYGNAYFDEAARTIEFGARIYNTPEQARARALASSIRDELTYLGPVQITTPVSDSFVAQGISDDIPRRQAIRAEREAREADAHEADAHEAETEAETDAHEADARDAPATGGDIQRNIPTL